jgi:outer membrane protein OmpA-like peptidoglycan-associated protein
MAPNTQTAQASAPTACAGDTACADGQLCVRSQCITITANMNECDISRVRFQPNTANLTPEGQQRLDRLARCLKASQNTQLVVETTADERGSVDANMRLGESRASQITRELEQRGVSADRLSTLTVASMTMICGPGKKCTVSEGGNLLPPGKRSAGTDRQGM